MERFMELLNKSPIGGPWILHITVVALVVALSVTVFLFGFRRVEEPEFEKLTDERSKSKGRRNKQGTSQKKSQANGHVTTSNESKSLKEPKSPSKKDLNEKSSPHKEKVKQSGTKSPSKQTAEKKNDQSNKSMAGKPNAGQPKGKENVDHKVKNKPLPEDKPEDFDEGQWEQALSKRDKKNRKAALEEIIPQKNEKKKDAKKKNSEDVQKEKEMKLTEVLAEIGISTEEAIKSVTEDDKVKSTEPAIKKDEKKKKIDNLNDKKITAADKQIKKQSEKQEVPLEEITEVVVEPEEPLMDEITEKLEILSKEPEPVVGEVVFDEIGDTWKEARNPKVKKTGKKKTRVD